LHLSWTFTIHLFLCYICGQLHCTTVKVKWCVFSLVVVDASLKLEESVVAPMVIDSLEYCDYTGLDGAPGGVLSPLTNPGWRAPRRAVMADNIAILGEGNDHRRNNRFLKFQRHQNRDGGAARVRTLLQLVCYFPDFPKNTHIALYASRASANDLAGSTIERKRLF